MHGLEIIKAMNKAQVERMTRPSAAIVEAATRVRGSYGIYQNYMYCEIEVKELLDLILGKENQ